MLNETNILQKNYITVFESTKEKTINISEVYVALKSVRHQKKTRKVAHIIHMSPV